MTSAHTVVRLRQGESWFVVVALVWLLVGPRIPVPGALGIRLEDLLFVALVVVVARTGARRRMLWNRANTGIAIVVVASLASTSLAVLAGRVSPALSVLYSLRPAEYWVAYPAAVLLLLHRSQLWTVRLRMVLSGITVLQTSFALGQYAFGLQIGFSHQSYARGAGLTAGPYELGAISAALLVYWIAQRRFLLAVVASVGLFVSISRISVIGAVAGLLTFWSMVLVKRIRDRDRSAPRSSTRRRRTLIATAAGLAGVLIAVVLAAATPAGARFTQDAIAPVAARFTETSITGSWVASERLAARIPPIATASQYNSVAFDHIFDHVDATHADDVGAEASNLVRFFRWHLILDTISTPDRVVLGLGPSFVGGSVDGSYLRFFADGGLLGIAAWLALIISWFRRTPPWMVGVIVTVLVGAVFIDIVYALRAMVLFWILLAIARHGAPPVPARPIGERLTAAHGVRPHPRPAPAELTPQR